MFRVIVLMVLALAACSQRTTPYRTAAQPEDANFAIDVPVGHTRYSHTSLAALFTDLHFDTEWGDSVPILLRIEPPVSVGLTGPGSAAYTGFLDALLRQIAEHANVEIGRGAAPHDITVRLVPGTEWGPLEDNQCIIVFGQPTWADFKANPTRYSTADKALKSDLSHRTVLIPNTHEPYLIRECLIEEITQALGPSNDIYGLAMSIFNDDDAHVWPTRLDYLMLRVLFHPAMKAGMPRTDAKATAERILREVNPEGRGAPALPAHRQMEFLGWRKKLHELSALISAGKTEARRTRDIVASLISEAESEAPMSAYHCKALTVAASYESYIESDEALGALDRAGDVCARAHGPDDIRGAELQLSRAFIALDNEKYRDALKFTDGLDAVFRAHGQDALTAATYALRWSALVGLEDPTAGDAQEIALKWSAFAYGDDNVLVERWRQF